MCLTYLDLWLIFSAAATGAGVVLGRNGIVYGRIVAGIGFLAVVGLAIAKFTIGV